MPAASRLTDFCTGHGCFPSRPSISASEDVFINDLGALRVGDLFDVHCCHSCHIGVVVSGSPDIYVNDEPLARIGDDIDCGSLVLTGSEDTFAND